MGPRTRTNRDRSVGNKSTRRRQAVVKKEKKDTKVPRACRQGGREHVMDPFTLIRANIMSAAVRKELRDMDPRADLCDGEGSEMCLLNQGFEVECERGACSNRVLQRGAFAPTVTHWYEGKGWGVKLKCAVDKGDVVEEYLGEIIEPETFWERYEKADSTAPMFFCEFVSKLVVDASKHGSYARWINHSCRPNAEIRHKSVKGMRRLVVVMAKDGDEGDEVTVGYRIPGRLRTWECACGEDSCVSNKKAQRGAQGSPAEARVVGSVGTVPADGPEDAESDGAGDDGSVVVVSD